MTLFGIDFDNTFTADPELFHAFVVLLKDRGHRCILVTQRGPEWNGDIRKVIGDSMPILNCPGFPKWMAAYEAGYDVDIWIEDNPHALTNGFTYTGVRNDGEQSVGGEVSSSDT